MQQEKKKLKDELERLEVRKDVMGTLVRDLKRQHDDILDSITQTKRKLQLVEQNIIRANQENTVSERARLVAQAAEKRQDGYRLGRASDYDAIDVTSSVSPSSTRSPIPQVTERLIDESNHVYNYGSTVKN